MIYHATIEKDDDGSLWARVDELPGLFISGFSLDELREALVEAVRLYFDAEKPRQRVAAGRKVERSVELRFVVPA